MSEISQQEETTLMSHDAVSLTTLEARDGEERQTPINWLNLVMQIKDGYRTQGRGIAHGVQKDAIQNSWDARIDPKGRGWRVRFELLSNGRKTLLAFTDEGTCGLTGRILKPEEMEEDLPQEERWGRFESLAFTKSTQGDIVPLGSRGRGKFIFVGASNDYSIFYDSLRTDGTYRLGTRIVKKTSSPIRAWNNSQAKEELARLSEDLLQPLARTGTRIVIENPVRELVESIRSGAFSSFIGETWWEIITKYGARISVFVDGKETPVEPPAQFVLPEGDSDQIKIWLLRNVKLTSGPGEYLIKRLHIACRKNGVDEDLRGVAIQRGGMKVCPIEPRYMPEDLASSIYGFVTLDKEAELKLLEDESPEHYGFDFRIGLPKSIRHFVEGEIEKFAHAKLGWRTDTRAIRREKQRRAERTALLEINRIAKALGFGHGIGPGKRQRKKGVKRPWKKIRIQLSELQFPRQDDIRLNYGESVKNIETRVVNDLRQDIAVRLKLFLRQGDKPMCSYVDEDVIVKSRQPSKHFGPFETKFDRKKFPTVGKMTLVARIISLMEENKGETLDEEKVSFYLEEDPPPRGIFEDCIATEWDTRDPDVGHLMGDDEPGERGGVVVHYNTMHPAYVAVEDDESDAAAYLFRLMAYVLLKLDLQTDRSKLYKEEEKKDNESIARATMRLMGDFAFRYYGRHIGIASDSS
jgi:hypothetical protein